MSKENEIDRIVEYYKSDKMLRYELDGFSQQVQSFFLNWPGFTQNGNRVIHSIKSRIKDPDHLREKIFRKSNEKRAITIHNFQNEITDLVGVRVLYLYQDQFQIIHEEIMRQINEKKEWKLVEPPKAYTWDPEAVKRYDELKINHEIKDTFYTSVHYVIKPYNDNDKSICCEIQVRTLFEEIWGEIDHSINYPNPTESVACKEQLKVLAKLISSGTRLSDAIFRSYNEYMELSGNSIVN